MHLRMKSGIVLTSIFFSLAASAQLGLPKMSALGGGQSAGQDLSGAQTQLVTQYVTGSNAVLTANAHMATALNLKDDAAKANAVAQAATTGATTTSLQNVASVSGATTQAIAAAMKNPPPMDANAKSEYTSGLANLGKGLIQYVGMKNSAASFAKSLTTVSPTMIPNLQVGAYIAKSLPGQTSDLAGALKNAVSFAQSHDIQVPADATAALSSL